MCFLTKEQRKWGQLFLSLRGREPRLSTEIKSNKTILCNNYHANIIITLCVLNMKIN